MNKSQGRWIGLSAHRVLIADLLAFSKRVPSIPVQRHMRLAAVQYARRLAVPRPSWCTLFTKAFAIVAAEMPELRRSYLEFPWPHLYEHPESIASVAVERHEQEGQVVVFAKLPHPDDHKLAAIDRYLKSFVGSKSKNMGLAQLGLWVSRLAWPLRYALWWWGLNSSGEFRAQHFGTFGVSVYSGLGAESLHPLSPLTFLINYGVIDDHGEVDVRLVYDHRVLDGATVARALSAMEATLHSVILDELNQSRVMPRFAEKSIAG